MLLVISTDVAQSKGPGRTVRAGLIAVVGAACLAASLQPSGAAAGVDPQASDALRFNGGTVGARSIPGLFDAGEDLDLLQPRESGWSIAVGDGNGGFAEPAPVTGLGDFRAVGDADSDGDTDAFLAGYPAQSGELDAGAYINNGAGSFAPSGSLPPAGSDEPQIAAVDLNSDAASDLIVTPSQPGLGQEASVLVNDGSGSFGDPVPLPIEVPAYRVFLNSPVVADIDGDAIEDVAICIGEDPLSPDAQPSRQLAVALGEPDGSFEASPDSPVQLDRDCVDLAAGDLDSDGFDDLVTPAADAVLRGSSDGTLDTAPPAPWSEIRTAATGQLDADGDLDLVLTSYRRGEEATEFWLNDGTGGFSSRPGLRLRRDDLSAPDTVVSLDGAGPDDLLGGDDPYYARSIWANQTGLDEQAPDTRLRVEAFERIQNRNPIAVPLDSDDPSVEIECSVEFGDWLPCDDGRLSVDLPDGTYSIRGRAVSATGPDPTPFEVGVRLDTTPPDLVVEKLERRSFGFPVWRISDASQDRTSVATLRDRSGTRYFRLVNPSPNRDEIYAPGRSLRYVKNRFRRTFNFEVSITDEAQNYVAPVYVSFRGRRPR